MLRRACFERARRLEPQAEQKTEEKLATPLRPGARWAWPHMCLYRPLCLCLESGAQQDPV